MELLKQKLKKKKYQYLYLEKNFNKWCEADYSCEIHHTSKFNIDDRLAHLLNWLRRINQKYNYI